MSQIIYVMNYDKFVCFRLPFFLRNEGESSNFFCNDALI